MSTNLDQAKKAYAEFEEKVKRTVLLDNLSPQVTTSVIKTALDQFGAVVSVEFIPNFTIPFNIPQAALVEMENPKQATSVINMMNDYPFMMSGMPRPVRACPAKAEMFADRPSPPDRKIQIRWVEPSDPDFEVAKELKQLVKRHHAETLALIKQQLEEEEKLAKQQQEMLSGNYRKYEMIENIMQDGTVARLARHYGVNFADEQ
ncbi:ASI1-immunoprecipitated protein 1-like [Typha angustifolia]|uniref:ASI1-immunoprecipitated protein 1-like n=1 Tax=Typha angustifolia TaxID=59011 RepID=UPI003C2E85D9